MPGPASRSTDWLALLHLLLHELRSPLNVAVGSLHALGGPDGGPLTPMQRALVDRAARSSLRLQNLATELRDWLTLAEGATIAAAAVPVAPLIEAAGERAERLRGGSVRVSRPVMGEATSVSGDARRLGSALCALVEAVTRAVPDGATVPLTVRTERAPMPGRADAVVVTIGDPGTQPDAGHPFEAEWQGGLGLALPLARAAIEAHGGSVWSRTDQGRIVGLAARLVVAPAPPAPAGGAE